MRYCPGRSLPPYAFLPGRDPHPVRDPEGHSYGADEAPPPHVPPDRWRESEEYLFGVDLYNHGFLWEAHEAWEGAWLVARRRDELQALFLQGLIQCAAAVLKIPMGQPRGLAKLSGLGTEKLERVAAEAGDVYMGLDVPPFTSRVRAFVQSDPGGIEERPRISLLLE